MPKNNLKILLAGGGTAGSVSPLLAIAESLHSESRIPNSEFLFVGSTNGPEQQMAQAANIKFVKISAGKLRRYFSLRNFTDIIKIKLAFWQAMVIILKFKPNIILTAGSFVAVPVAWAGWLLRIPIIVHQQDVVPGLANKLMAPIARVVTCTLAESVKDFGVKAIFTGNPSRVRSSKSKAQNQVQNIKLNNLPVVLIMGGGTGALKINELVIAALPKLTAISQIIHITGKHTPSTTNYQLPSTNYQHYEFLDYQKLHEAYAAANIVISRAGMGSLSELAALGKPTIIIPMPDSHQEANAAYFAKRQAAVVINEKTLTADGLIDKIKELLDNKDKQEKLSENIKKIVLTNANEKYLEIINKIIK